MIKSYNSSLSKSKTPVSVLLTLLFVYVILFEFILPFNNVIPKPTLILESLVSLWNDYNLFDAFASSTSVVYVSLLLGYLIVNFLSGYLIKIYFEFPGIYNGLKIFRYFPAFFYAVLFAFWFPTSLLAEFIFVLIAAIFFYGLSLIDQCSKADEAYIDSAKSFGLSNQKIYSKVVWKNCQPEVFKSTYTIHYYLWILILLFEFIGGVEGFGSLYKSVLEFSDFAGLFALAVVIAILIWLGNLAIKVIENKLIYWK